VYNAGRLRYRLPPRVDGSIIDAYCHRSKRMSQFTVVLIGRRPPSLEDPAGVEVAATGARVLSTSYDAPDYAEVAAQADAFVFSGGFSADQLAKAPKCKIVARDGIGYDGVDIEAATKQKVFVTIIPDALIDDVADVTMMLLTAANRRLSFLDGATRRGEWRDAMVDLVGNPPRKLKGATLGLVGLGRIGRAVAQRARGFGLRVVAADPVTTAEQAASAGAELVSLDALLEQADFVSVHTPLLPTTRHLISTAQFAKMKRTAVLINTSRGPVVDEAALIEALRSGQIRAAGLDVFEKEPIDPANPLLTMSNVVVTPHIASVSDVSNVERRQEAAREVVRVMKGETPRHEAVVNKELFSLVTA
jgi:phosphoglycerate dehydrogenase-like enzyme